jgi:hypothetical protein
METTQVYLQADLALKEKALAKAAPLGIKIRRYRPDDKLLAFLNSRVSDYAEYDTSQSQRSVDICRLLGIIGDSELCRVPAAGVIISRAD